MIDLSNLVSKLYSQPPTNIDLSEWYPVVGVIKGLFNTFKGQEGIYKELAFYSLKPLIPFVVYHAIFYATATTAARYIADKL